MSALTPRSYRSQTLDRYGNGRGIDRSGHSPGAHHTGPRHTGAYHLTACRGARSISRARECRRSPRLCHRNLLTL